MGLSSISLGSQVISLGPKLTLWSSLEPQVTSLKPQMTSLNPQRTSLSPAVTSSESIDYPKPKWVTGYYFLAYNLAGTPTEIYVGVP